MDYNLKQNALVRFKEKYKKDAISGCWIWTAGKSVDGFGRFGLNGKNTNAHRVSWLLFNGDLGDSLVVHKCSNLACVNPEHLIKGDSRLKGNVKRVKYTHCNNGHEFTGENIKTDKHGNRKCKICYNEYMKKYRST